MCDDGTDAWGLNIKDAAIPIDFPVLFSPFQFAFFSLSWSLFCHFCRAGGSNALL